MRKQRVDYAEFCEREQSKAGVVNAGMPDGNYMRDAEHNILLFFGHIQLGTKLKRVQRGLKQTCGEQELRLKQLRYADKDCKLRELNMGGGDMERVFVQSMRY